MADWPRLVGAIPTFGSGISVAAPGPSFRFAMASSLVQRANRVNETARQAPKTPEVLFISERDPDKSWERMTRRLLHILAVLSLHKVLTEDLVTLNDEKRNKKKKDVEVQKTFVRLNDVVARPMLPRSKGKAALGLDPVTCPRPMPAMMA